MAIGTTTGKKCLQGILSKVIAGKLIAEGITDKPIDKITYKSTHSLLRVDSNGNLYETLHRVAVAEPQWFPSFIDAEIWAEAVKLFKPNKNLEKNVEKYLLPKMDKYVENIPDAELVSITRDFLTERGILNTPISQREWNTYYFNEDEIYSLDKKSQLFPYRKRGTDNVFDVKCEAGFNTRVWRKAVSRFEAGMTLKECIEIFLKTELARPAPALH